MYILMSYGHYIYHTSKKGFDLMSEADKMMNAMLLFAEISAMNAENEIAKQERSGIIYGESDFWRVIGKYN